MTHIINKILLLTLTVLYVAAMIQCNTQPGVKPWQIALLAREDSRIRGIAAGSSTTEGVGANPTIQRWPNRMEKMLQSSYNPADINGGYSLRALDASYLVPAGSVGVAKDGLGLQSRLMQANATLTHTTLQNSTGFAIYFAQGSGAGTFQVIVDNYAPITVYPNTTGPANRHDGEWHSPVYPRQSHRVVIKALGTCVINTVYVYDNDNDIGLQLFNSGIGGSVISDFDIKKVPEFYRRISSLQPQFVSIMLGSNEYASQMSIDTYKNSFRSVIKSILTVVKQTPWIPLIGMPQRLDTDKPIPYEAYIQALQEIVAEFPQCCSFHDLTPYFPKTRKEDDAEYKLFAPDGVHPNTRGHQYEADLLAHMWTLPSRRVSAHNPPQVNV